MCSPSAIRAIDPSSVPPPISTIIITVVSETTAQVRRSWTPCLAPRKSWACCQRARDCDCIGSLRIAARYRAWPSFGKAVSSQCQRERAAALVAPADAFALTGTGRELAASAPPRESLFVAAHDDAMDRDHLGGGKFKNLLRIVLFEPQPFRVLRDKALDVGVRNVVVAQCDLRHDKCAARDWQARIDEHHLAGEIARLHRVADHVNRVGAGHARQARRRQYFGDLVAVENELAVPAAHSMPVDRYPACELHAGPDGGVRRGSR